MSNNTHKSIHIVCEFDYRNVTIKTYVHVNSDIQIFLIFSTCQDFDAINVQLIFCVDAVNILNAILFTKVQEIQSCALTMF